jgi:acyl-CoA thioesterase I
MRFEAMMMRNFQTLIWIIVAALVLSVLGACSKSPKIQPISSNATILAFGDSLTFGTGATPETSYPAVLKNLIGMNVVAHGVPGEVSADGLRRLSEVLDEVKPALLILCHGGNDFLQKKPEAEAAANVRAMVSLAKNKGISVVLIATPKPGFSVAPPDFYAEIAKEFSIPIESKVLREILTDNSLKSDLVHPNAAGYKLIAERVAELLRKSGAIS